MLEYGLWRLFPIKKYPIISFYHRTLPVFVQQDPVTRNLISVMRLDLSDNRIMFCPPRTLRNGNENPTLHWQLLFIEITFNEVRVSKEKLKINYLKKKKLLGSTIEWRKPNQGQNWLLLFDVSSVDEKRDCNGLTKCHSILTFKRHILNNRLQTTRTRALDIF